MSIQIHNDGIASLPASQSAPAGNVTQSNSPAKTGSAANTGADQVDISTLSGNIASSSSALASQQASRVQQLAALYAKGQYQVDARQLSSALVSRALASGSVGEDS